MGNTPINPRVFCNLRNINFAPSVRVVQIDGLDYFEFKGPVYASNRAATNLVFIIRTDVVEVHLAQGPEDYYICENDPLKYSYKNLGRKWIESCNGVPSKTVD